MEDQAVPLAEQPRRSPVWKLVAYFAGLVLFGQIARLVFEGIQDAEALRGFVKINQVIKPVARPYA
jgi:hypothetical protein